MAFGRQVLKGVAVAAAAVTLVALAQPAGAAHVSVARHSAHTRKVVVRPVHRDGRPVRGYRVVRERHNRRYYTCTFHSPVAVSPGVAWCGGTADNTIACWKSIHHTVLCLRDPRVRTLVRIRYGGTFQSGHRLKHVSPETLVLARHGYCSIRLGGAWDRVKKHPHWVGYYGCTGRNFSAIYGPRRLRDGTNRSVNPWRVHVLIERGTYPHIKQIIRPDRVRTAYYVGTAR